MRLLQRNNSGEFSLIEHFGDDIPRYAILSHTWGAEEVTFKDLVDSTGKDKSGYEKIRFCAQQAADDGLQYFWVDTCCIDKSSSAELQEAINSMFRWYQNAVKCYVYLSDVSTRKQKASDSFSEYTWESAFRSSRWFTRGWTLQELLAPGPSSVEFFSQEENRLGDKGTLEQQIHEITGIAITALRGTPLSHFDVDNRLLWAENRQTTREEDKAYSLFGIFDIQIPILYGEGLDKAFTRLRQEIDKPLKGLDRLPSAADASFSSYNKQHLPSCLPDTRVDLLKEIYGWAAGQDERCIFWLNGLAGTGKSTIARTVARRYFDQKGLGASFFFSRGGGDVGHAGKFFTSLAVQLARNVPQIQRFISDAIIEQNDIANQSLRDQWRQLVLRPLLRLDSSSYPSPSYVLVVDALDECDSEDDIGMIIQLLTEVRTLKTVRLRVFLTSRPDMPIRHGFYQIPGAERQDFVLHNISPSIINHDISIFLQYNLNLIASERSLHAGWPGEQIVERLVCNASGLFIWAATACRFIREGKIFAAKRLDMLLESSSIAVNAPEKHLNEIYLTVLQHSISPNYTSEEVEELRRILKSFLGSIVTLFSPLSTQSLSKLVHTSQEEVDQTLHDLHAILDIPKDQNCPLRLHHPSFRDFLLNKQKCDEYFYVDEMQAHRTLANNCIRLMSNSLKQNVCGQEAPGTLVADVESIRIEHSLPPEVRYACLYWIRHLQKSGTQLYDDGVVYQFIQNHLLHWLEALSWIGRTSEGILAMLSLEAQIPAENNSNLHAFIHDANRFALYNRSIIEQTPLQLYCSALVFAPEKSIVRRQFEKCIPSWVQMKSKAQADWGAALQALEGHAGRVTSVAFSPDGKQVVSGSADKTVRLWDAATGTALLTLEGHTEDVAVVIYSPDGQQLASASSDYTVRLWDTKTGSLQQTLQDYSGRFGIVEYSPNGQQLASASHYHTIRLWDAETGDLQQILEGHSDTVRALIYSPNGHHLASASQDKTVRLWDTADGTLQRILEGHNESVMAMGFSPNGNRLVSGSEDDTVRLWDVETGSLQHTLQGHSSWVGAVTYSSNGKQLASASYDHTIRLWDAETGALQQILEGHSDVVCALVYSPNRNHLASASWDSTVRLWDIDTGILQQIFKGHYDSVRAIKFSPDGKRLASASDDHTVRLWNSEMYFLKQPLQGHSRMIQALAFSPDGCRLASGSKDNTIGLWDTEKGTLERILEGHTDWVTSVTFSPDGRRLASAPDGNLYPPNSDLNTIHIWDTETGALQHKLVGHSGGVEAIAFSPDGLWLVSAAFDDTVRIWDSEKGALQKTLEAHCKYIRAITFSPDGGCLASASSDKKVRIYNFRTGAIEQTLEAHTQWVDAVALSPDGGRLASASRDDTVMIWRAETGALEQTFRTGVSEETWFGSYGSVMAMTFSPDEQRLITNLGSMELFNSNSGPHTAKWPSYSLPNVDRCWIMWNECKVLWLPVEYRPECQSFHGNFIAMGHASGGVTIIKLGAEGVPGNLSATTIVPLFNSH